MRTQLRFTILTLATLFLVTVWGRIAYGAEGGSQFGLIYGMSVPDADNTNPFRLMGVKGAALLFPSFSAGGYYLLSDSSGEPSSINKFRFSFHGIEGAYHMPTGAGDTFVALRAGLTKLKKSPTGTDIIFSPYHYGLATGYDYLFTTWLSVGFEGSFMHVLQGSTTLDNVEYTSDAFNVISFLVSIQLRL